MKLCMIPSFQNARQWVTEIFRIKYNISKGLLVLRKYGIFMMLNSLQQWKRATQGIFWADIISLKIHDFRYCNQSWKILLDSIHILLSKSLKMRLTCFILLSVYCMVLSKYHLDDLEHLLKKNTKQSGKKVFVSEEHFLKGKCYMSILYCYYLASRKHNNFEEFNTETICLSSPCSFYLTWFTEIY